MIEHIELFFKSLMFYGVANVVMHLFEVEPDPVLGASLIVIYIVVVVILTIFEVHKDANR